MGRRHADRRDRTCGRIGRSVDDVLEPLTPLDNGGETPHLRGMALLREEPDQDAVQERSVVLDAMGIAHEVQPTPEGRWAILVEDVDFPAAEAALSAWEAENLPRPEVLARPDYGGSLVGLVVGLALLAFAARAGLGPAGSLFERGSADAARMLQGQWWRAATALTLHADLAHVAANAVALGIFVGAVARRLGPALATWLALAAGVLGNALTALALRGGHVSVGASTAVFGALGTLSALQVPRRSAWLTLGVGVALLGLLGTGERADLAAHLFGFGVGISSGLAIRRMTPPRRSLWQPALALLAVTPIVLAWWRALAP
jgi:membrane associated rhomboid family serine protease